MARGEPPDVLNTAPNLTLNQIVEKETASIYDRLNTAPNLTLAQPAKEKKEAPAKEKDPAVKDAIG